MARDQQRAQQPPLAEDRDARQSPLLSWLRGMHRAPRRDRLAATLVLMVAASVTLPWLGAIGFFDPWETHYAEVARQMAARDDYLYPFWKDAHFFSKPILLFWLTSIGYRAIGAHTAVDALPEATELVGRLPGALFSLLAVACVFLTVRRLWSLRAAVLSSLVLATLPFWAMMSRQAITDMLYVAPMSMAICLLALAFFASDEARAAQQARPIPRSLTTLFALGLFPQMWEIGRSGSFLNRVAFLGAESTTRLAASVALVAVAGIFLMLLHRVGRDPLVHAAAFLCAIATLGKGPHALLLLGLVFFLYLLVTGEWRLLRRPAMWTTALALYLWVALPWYLVMALFGGRDESRKTWFGRFVMADLLGRIGQGVHGDRGTFEYYVRYLAFGMFPWAAALPVALFEAVSQPWRAMGARTSRDRFLLFVSLWFVAFLVFFTATTTKFHHYIFPAVVPAAILIGVWLDRLLDQECRLLPAYSVVIVLGAALLARDLSTEPWQLIDLFTYHYKSWKPDYYFPTTPNWHLWVAVAGFATVTVVVCGLLVDLRFRSLHSLSALCQAALGGRSRPSHAAFVLSFVTAGVCFSIFVVQIYLSQMSQHWSQRYLLNTYYALRQPGEPLLSYQMDWKGETFYAHNDEIQIKKSPQTLKKHVDEPGRAFVLVQTDRFDRIKTALGAKYEGKIKIVDRSNKKWFLVVVND
ncbi:MAG: ArnT family glycosyltransferase [Myxococcota bacterium]